MSKAPHQTVLQAALAAVPTAGNDLASVVGVVPYAGVVESVDYVPTDDITGAATNNRRLRLVNKGDDGTGTAVVAEIQFTSGTDAADFDATALTLSGTAANLVVAEGDVLAWESTSVGTGIADPGGRARVEIARA